MEEQVGRALQRSTPTTSQQGPVTRPCPSTRTCTSYRSPSPLHSVQLPLPCPSARFELQIAVPAVPASEQSAQPASYPCRSSSIHLSPPRHLHTCPSA